MAILLRQVLRLINSKLPAITENYFENFAPASATDLHIVYNLISNTISFGFEKDYEKIRIQFSVFDRYSNSSRVLDYMAELEMLFDHKFYPFPDEGEGGIQSNCIDKANETLTYLQEEEFWQGTMDFIFFCQKNPEEDDQTTSSETESHSSSSSESGSYSSESSSSESSDDYSVSSSSSSSYRYSTSSRSSSSVSSESV